MTFYNEHNKFAAGWLRNLSEAGHIAKGVVDERDIQTVRREDLAGMRRVHFFAGIGGWDYALRLAGWPADREVWTGSCPCQPFSRAGKGKGVSDERHLWPDMFRLIRECRPPVVFGEQVANKATKAWIDGVFNDLEGIAYSCGQAVVPACSVGSPTIGARLFWVATTAGSRRCGRAEMENGRSEEPRGPSEDILPQSWPGGSGCRSSLSFSDVCSPAYGVPARVGRLRGYGNSIVPQLAAEFVRAFLEAESTSRPESRPEEKMP